MTPFILCPPGRSYAENQYSFNEWLRWGCCTECHSFDVKEPDCQLVVSHLMYVCDVSPRGNACASQGPEEPSALIRLGSRLHCAFVYRRTRWLLIFCSVPPWRALGAFYLPWLHFTQSQTLLAVFRGKVEWDRERDEERFAVWGQETQRRTCARTHTHTLRMQKQEKTKSRGWSHHSAVALFEVSPLKCPVVQGVRRVCALVWFLLLKHAKQTSRFCDSSSTGTCSLHIHRGQTVFMTCRPQPDACMHAHVISFSHTLIKASYFALLPCDGSYSCT